MSVAFLLLLLVIVPGCSLVVMAGKIFYGDPKMVCQFKQRSGVDLLKDEKEVLILCSAPEFLRTDHASLDRDIIDGMYRKFRLHEMKCVNPNKVDSWLGRVGGLWDDINEVAEEFDTDYIIQIEIDDISYYEENSAGFYRGNVHGMVSVYEVREKEETRGAFLVFQHEYKSQYPHHYPVSVDSMSERTFSEKFNSRVANELARLFYDYHSSEALD